MKPRKMIGYERSDEDYQPLTYIGNYPLYLTMLLVALHVAAAVGCCVLMSFQATNVLGALMYSGHGVLGQYRIWEIFTYAFVHIPRQGDSIGPSLIGFFIEMYLLMFFGRETERFLGRRVFSILYLALLLTTPLLLTLGSAIFHFNFVHDGSAVLHLSVFIAFATIYPNLAFFFGVLAKWMAWIALAGYTLGCIAYNEWSSLVLLWAGAGVAHFGVRYAGAGGGLPSWSVLRGHFPQKTIPSGVKPRLKPRRMALENVSASGSSASGGGDVHESIDPLLDKISKHGLASLTHSERATLERARASLLRKERGG